MLDSKFLECQSVTVRNVCRSACFMFRWPVADMTVLKCYFYMIYGWKLYCAATICNHRILYLEWFFFFSFVAVYNQCSDWCLKGSVQLKYFFLSFFLSIGSSILYNLFHTSSREVEGTILHFINYCNCPNLNSCRWLRTLRQSHQRDVSLARRLYTPSKSNVRWCNLRWFLFKWKLTSCKTGCWL